MASGGQTKSCEAGVTNRQRLRARGTVPIPVLVAVLALALAAIWVGNAGATEGWLKNLGFEEDLAHWEVTEPAAGTAVAVGEEGPTEFPVFDTLGVTVSPLGGDKMLRLGAPKGTDTHQVKGLAAVEQTFVSDGRPIQVAYRVITWEHRSRDTFVINVTDSDGNPVQEANVEVIDASGELNQSTLPYSAPMVLEEKEKYRDFGWSEVRISNLPNNGETFTLSYALSNPDDASHDTWVYVDQPVLPPVAEFTWAPGGPGGEQPHEGDVIGLYGDLSYDPDRDDGIVKWEWRISDGEAEEVYNEDTDFQSPVGFIVPYDQGAYDVTLTVWDQDGLSNSTTKTISVQNYIPRVNALNIEVLAGGSARLVGRFLDPGWMDDHSARWESDSGHVIAGQVVEDHFATLSSGYVGGIVSADDTDGPTQTWTLAVKDYALEDDGEWKHAGTDTFEVAVITPDPDRFEDEDAFPEVKILPSDGAYLSYIQSKGDLDIFEVKMPDGNPLPQGTELLVTLRDLPADYDLAVFESATGSLADDGAQAAPFMHSPFSTAPFMHSPFMHSAYADAPFMHSPFMHSPFMHSAYMDAPFMHSPFMHSPFMHSALVNSPFMHSPFMHSPFMHSPFMHSPFMHSPFMHSPIPAGWSDLDGYPLSAMSFTGTANDNTSGIDISFVELGFDHEALQDLRVLGFSANPGIDSEVVLATTGYPQTAAVEGHVYVAVKSAIGGFSASHPYTLQIETSRPLDLLAMGQTRQAPVVADPSTETTVVYAPADPPLTLFVTQLDRLSALYPEGSTPGDARDGGQIVEEALLAAAELDKVKGKIISLPADRYTAWDEEPWRVDLANELARSLRWEIQAELEASVQYIVLVGNDRVVPFQRLVDQTVVGNEQGYTDQCFLMPPSATLSSIANGYILTDDYYVDEAPISWSGSYLYIPDLAVSRLVEKPAEIAGTIQAFIDADGVLARTAALVSGYDFMADGAQAVRDILAGVGMTMPDAEELLLGDDWRGEDLWGALSSGTDVGNLNAHFTHFAGLSAYGYWRSVAEEPYDQSEFLLSGDMAAAGGGSLFESRLVFSMGCHAGLNIPDEEAAELSPGDPIDPALDLPQAMMQQGGLYLGSTGYGYGDTTGIGGTEALIGYFAERLVGEAGSVGLALVQAKQDYLGSLSTLTPYDQKSSVQFTLYGMPHYQLPEMVTAAQTIGAFASSVAAASLAAESEPLGSFRLKLTERSVETDQTVLVIDRSYELRLHETASGNYITADGRSETTPDRPIHPLVPVPLAEQPQQGPAHGFLYKAGTYPTIMTEFRPAISRYTTEWEVGPTAFQIATKGFWPVKPGVLTTRQTPTGYRQAFVAVPAQFKATTTVPKVMGIERVWSYLEGEILRSTTPAGEPEDWLPPSVRDVDLWVGGDGVTVSIDARDSSGISRIVVLLMDQDGMRIPPGGDQHFPKGPESSDRPWGFYQDWLRPSEPGNGEGEDEEAKGGKFELSSSGTLDDPSALPLDTAVGSGSPLTPDESDERYEVTFELDGMNPADIALLFQVVDGCGNVTTLTGRGATVQVPAGLRNAGFEQGLRYWEVTQPASGTVSVVGVDGEVEPYSGERMLRIGVPKGTDYHQIKGLTSVGQRFLSDGEDIEFVYRIITYDSRARDVFVVNLRDLRGNIVGDAVVEVIDPAGLSSAWSLPYRVSTKLDKDEDYRDFGWYKVSIKGLSAYSGRILTLSFTLDNTKDASHDTWIYVDQGSDG